MAPADVYCHHHTQQSEYTARFSLHITDRLATKPKMPIFRPNNNTKNYTYLSSIFNPNNSFKNEKSTFTANLKVRSWYLTGRFPLNAFRGLYFSHFIRPSLEYLTLPRSHPKRILGNSAIARAYNSCHPSVEPPSTTSKISNPLNILLLQTRQNCLGRSWNPSTKRPERQLHSWASMSATQHVWRLSQHETISHPCFLSEACLYTHSSLMMPEWGLLQRKMARKTPSYKPMILPDSCSCARSNKQQPSLASRDNIA